MYLRDFKEEYKILRNINNPVIIIGLPLKLAFIYLGVILGAVVLVFVLSNFDIPAYVVLGVPAGLVFLAIMIIRKFYSIYGLHGFYQQNRDNHLPSKIEADMSIEQILNSKYETK
ncbi:DUF4133 domain-containing protein [Capnocytophaga canis]|uniref:PrgI family protein n=1 Tax=Capnocytophaga canis TaxID=1848903 RepID=A0A0B7ILL7_9FLAO|nr:DUF4133 domain-containing protein [Capnocytophaga canis]CEN52735.1 hypothetical protein CCAND93_290006 [Capnocytophaga canis]